MLKRAALVFFFFSAKLTFYYKTKVDFILKVTLKNEEINVKWFEHYFDSFFKVNYISWLN